MKSLLYEEKKMKNYKRLIRKLRLLREENKDEQVDFKKVNSDK